MTDSENDVADAGPPDESDTRPDEATDAVESASEVADDEAVDVESFHDAVEQFGRPVVTAEEVARALDRSQAETDDALAGLAEGEGVERLDVSNDPVVWYPTDWGKLADRERVIVFPKRRELVVDQPTQFTRAQLSQFAHLVDTTRDGGYIYEIRQEDVWAAPFDDFEDLLGTLRDVLPERSPHLEEWMESQWKRARQFVLRTDEEDGYVVLEAASEDLMGNVARQRLDEGQLRAPLSDTESWVAEESVAEVKRVLYEAGYPVRDERDLDTGEELDVTLNLRLRDYQQEWVNQFVETKSGVLVGPPGSGKTVAGMGAIEAVGGETLILVPGRELASQWHEELLANTTLAPDQIGEYHGGTKDVRPVTIATYQTAGMDRHRQLFDQREWGLIIYDEVHHVPSRVFRRSAELQSKHRLGLSATPVREDDKEEEIFTLIGPPIGTDWDALFEAGYVQEPEVQIRYVPWDDETYRNEYGSADGHEKRQIAASNPAKLREIRHLRAEHPHAKTLIFVEYLDQGEALAEALNVPFISGEMRHARREQLLQQFKSGQRDALVVSRVGDEGIDLPDAELAIVASGLGGSRRQGAQRAGRTMRPTGNSRMYVLATRGTTEEDFARRRMQHLSAKGVRVTEQSAEAVEDRTP
ncbi:DEAD/DEAH box helicase [Halorussus sp. MSC15.2]|uniref:DEAD/DEAH box helicase n=1 Tax=Halorussus sp. MSC15.2 TaxID=2283638 RepID=UPI0013D3653A|nr:DEAD/DEAH box helicase family protein [Halorussus sp. MSC15.2]NEU58036.1 DEAD/DEAH box helicase family protein [Halorussus sp. MSC15.2]